MPHKQALSVLIYDGKCSFCCSQMERIRRWDGDGSFEYLVNEDPSLSTRFPQLEGQDLQSGLRLVTPEGRVHVGADAVYQISRRLPFWGRLAWLYRVPGCSHLARWTYGWIASHRYRLGRCGSGDACQIR